MKSIYERLVEQYGFSPAQKIIIGLVTDGEVLEVGSSSGYMTKEFAKASCIVDVVEKEESFAQKAGKIARQVFVGSIEDKNLQQRLKKSYDFIVCADVLEHMVDPEKVLHFLKMRLKKRGFILISIPNIAFWNMRLELLGGKFDYQESGLLDRTHLRFYTYNSFLALLKKVGLKIVKIYPAEGRIPLEYSLRKIPLLGKMLIALFKPKLMEVFPNLTIHHYVVKATK